jgi:hypothetical protein
MTRVSVEPEHASARVGIRRDRHPNSVVGEVFQGFQLGQISRGCRRSGPFEIAPRQSLSESSRHGWCIGSAVRLQHGGQAVKPSFWSVTHHCHVTDCQGPCERGPLLAFSVHGSFQF